MKGQYERALSWKCLESVVGNVASNVAGLTASSLHPSDLAPLYTCGYHPPRLSDTAHLSVLPADFEFADFNYHGFDQIF